MWCLRATRRFKHTHRVRTDPSGLLREHGEYRRRLTGGLHAGLMFSCFEEGNKNSSSSSWKQTHLGIDQGGLERRERQDQDQDLNPTTHLEEKLSQCLAVRLSWQLLRSGAGDALCPTIRIRVRKDCPGRCLTENTNTHRSKPTRNNAVMFGSTPKSVWRSQTDADKHMFPFLNPHWLSYTLVLSAGL